MARVILPAGRQAKTPYRLSVVERNIYSAEELCYLLVQSARLLDGSIMDPDLVDWLDGECGLTALAGRLRPMLGRERELSDFVALILDEVGFIPKEKSESARVVVASGRGMEQLTQRMKHAAQLAENARPYEALEEYDAVLRELPEPERAMRTKALCAQGRIYADLFRFHAAADCYEQAHDLSGSQEIYLKYLAAVRMELTDAEYLSYIAEHPEVGDASLELEKRLEEIRADYEHSEAQRLLEQLRQYREAGQDTNYEIALHRELQRIKDDYKIRRAPADAEV